jgi:hypothetical protein
VRDALRIYRGLANSSRFSDDPVRQRDLAEEYGRKGNAFRARGDSTKDYDDLRKAAETYRLGIAVIDTFMQRNPKGGTDPEAAHRDLQKIIQMLPSELW